MLVSSIPRVFLSTLYSAIALSKAPVSLPSTILTRLVLTFPPPRECKYLWAYSNASLLSPRDASLPIQTYTAGCVGLGVSSRRKASEEEREERVGGVMEVNMGVPEASERRKRRRGEVDNVAVEAAGIASRPSSERNLDAPVVP